MIISDYPFDEYICDVTGLTCCGCSLFCGNREEKKNNEEAKMNDAMLKQSLENQKVIMHGLSLILEHMAFGNRSASTLIDVRNKIMAQYSETGELLYKGE